MQLLSRLPLKSGLSPALISLCCLWLLSGCGGRRPGDSAPAPREEQPAVESQSKAPQGEKSLTPASTTPSSMRARASLGPDQVLFCRKAPSAGISVDGKIEQAWHAADTLSLEDPAQIPDPNRAKIYTMWDEKYLYLAFEVSDRRLKGFQTERDHKALYKDDMVEVLIDPRRDATDEWLEDDIVYHINVLGQVKDDRGTPEGRSDAGWQSEALFAVTVDGTLNDSTDIDRGFSVELAVPWTEIGKTPQAGVTLGIDFATGDAEGRDEHLWDWCGARPFRQPSVYGVLELE
ncbi:MAG: sugar-binding protein [Gemmatimonadota bacterium]|nr:sugar-binding protein [Gemmatimonadota bacterium]